MIKVLIGNMFDTSAQTIINTVNCVGVMGKGIALEFKNRYPGMYKDYIERCKKEELKPGQPYYYSDLLGASIIMFPTKDHWRSQSRLSYIRSGLEWITKNYKDFGIESLAVPPLGCGNGGLTWDHVGPIIYGELSKLPINIELYAPYGTSPSKLSISYLKSHSQPVIKDIVGNKAIPINAKWYLILEVLKQLQNNRYAPHVGRIVFQKICYVLTRLGVQTGLQFTKGTYGPYSKQVNDVSMAFANANLIAERRVKYYKNMIEVYVSPNFELDKSKYTENEIECVNRVVDLFSRIHTSEQAEIMATTLFSFDELSKQLNDKPTEMDIFNYMMNWKTKRWADKQNDIASSIRNLGVLGWINPVASNDLPCIEEYA